MHERLSTTASLLSDPGRAAILLALLDGIALPAGQLARVANVAPQTASSHLAKLVTGQLLIVEQQGRHRYYRLASAEVASAVEGLLSVTPAPRKAACPCGVPADLAYARSCYSHLAGQLAVEVAAALLRRELVADGEARNALRVTADGRVWFEQLGIRATTGRRCLDWTERRHHLAGELGQALLTRLKDMKWIVPVRDSRAVRVTLEGERRLWELLEIRVQRS